MQKESNFYICAKSTVQQNLLAYCYLWFLWFWFSLLHVSKHQVGGGGETGGTCRTSFACRHHCLSHCIYIYKIYIYVWPGIDQATRQNGESKCSWTSKTCSLLRNWRLIFCGEPYCTICLIPCGVWVIWPGLKRKNSETNDIKLGF